MLTRDQVIWAYRCFFGREPESEQRIQEHSGYATWDDLRSAFIHSVEFRNNLPIVSLAGRFAMAPSIRVDLRESANELAEMFAHVSASWADLGQTEPHWSVLTSDEFKSERIRETEEAFYATGKKDRDLIEAFFSRNGRSLGSVHKCLEFGCGVGRATFAIADMVRQVCAIDISQPHLSLARNRQQTVGISNVDFVHLTSIADLDGLPEFDLLYSTIVLQHNPPPVTEHILNILFSKVNDGGYVLFQVPTYRTGYCFDWTDYLENKQQSMEMHVLPQQTIFDLFRRYDISLIEVQEDGLTGSDIYLSNTFYGRREVQAAK